MTPPPVLLNAVVQMIKSSLIWRMNQKGVCGFACPMAASPAEGGSYRELKLTWKKSVLGFSLALAATLHSDKDVWRWRMEGRQQVQDSCCLQYPIFLSGLQQSTRGGWKTPAADDIWRGGRAPSISLPSAARAAVSRKEPRWDLLGEIALLKVHTCKCRNTLQRSCERDRAQKQHVLLHLKKPTYQHCFLNGTWGLPTGFVTVWLTPGAAYMRCVRTASVLHVIAAASSMRLVLLYMASASWHHFLTRISNPVLPPCFSLY